MISKNRSHSQKPARATPKDLSKFQSSLPGLLYFSSLKHTKSLHEAHNTLPDWIHNLDVIKLQNIFSLFFPDDILQELVINTNIYAEMKRNESDENDVGKGRKWSPCNVGELKSWFGIITYMGIISLPATRDYWKHNSNSLYPYHEWIPYMSQTRFEEIKCFFHVTQLEAATHNGAC